MATQKHQKNDDKDFYYYEREYEKTDGTTGKIKQKVPKKEVLRRELIKKSKDNGKYIYEYKTFYKDGTTKNIKMVRKYNPKKSKNLEKSDSENE